MALDNLFKLEKLKIKAYKDVKRNEADFIDTFEAMFNPESFSRKFEVVYGKSQGINASEQTANYSRNAPAELNLKLVLDGTGASELGISRPVTGIKVSEQVDKLLKLTFGMNGDIHEPNYLVVAWGDLNFSCRFGSLNVNYTSFDRSGVALRAELDITLYSDLDVEKRKAKDDKKSPDLTHSRIVMAGDTLPLLVKQIYGSSAHYLWLAGVNQLDDFRNLVPGRRLHFPPLPQGTTGLP